MMTEATFRGGAQAQATFGSDLDFQPKAGRLAMLQATTTSLAVVMPDATSLVMLGGPWAIIVNTGANDFDVEDNANGTLVTLEPDTAATLYLADATTAAGTWVAVKKDVVAP